MQHGHAPAEPGTTWLLSTFPWLVSPFKWDSKPKMTGVEFPPNMERTGAVTEEGTSGRNSAPGRRFIQR
jgi:hypothetical protein